MKILHFSDIHWHGFQRHEEYTKIFQDFFEKAKAENPSVIVCTGDIFHTKTSNITPEVIDKMVWMFEQCAEIAPLHIILGNHDGNLSNNDRQDAISPIISAMKNNKNIHLYKESGSYPLASNGWAIPYVFHVFSCFDKEGWNKVSPMKGLRNIALYHGSVTGCRMDNGMALGKGEVGMDMFEPYDLALLGDIHKTQVLGYRDGNPWIGYPGSTIQQNFGEDETKGFYIWEEGEERNKWSVRFVALENRFSFVTTEWKGTVEATIAYVVDTRKAKAFERGSRYRIESNVFISVQEQKELKSRLLTVGVAEVIFKINTKESTQVIKTESVTGNKMSLRNDPDAITKLFFEYVSTPGSKINLSKEQMLKAAEIIKEYHKKIVLSGADADELARDVIWKVHSMDFDNVFQYGAGNKVDFDKLEGVVGILGKNRIGKSSLIGTLMYSLFNTSERGVSKAARIINKNKTECVSRVKFSVDGTMYEAVRASKKKVARGKVDHESASSSLVLNRYKEDGSIEELISENGDTRVDTDKNIRKLIGKVDDFMLTSYANNKNLSKFIDDGPTFRKDVLKNFLDVDFINLFHVQAKEKYTEITKQLSQQKTIDVLEERKTQLQNEIDGLVSTIALADTELVNLADRISTKTASMSSQTVNSFDSAKKTESKLRSEVEGLNATIARLEQQKRVNATTLAQRAESLSAITNQLSDLPSTEELARKKKELADIRQQLASFTASVAKQTLILDNKKKSVRKLDMVPCGDQFPSCMYIKDSHDDKKTLEEQIAKVAALLDQQKGLENGLELYSDIESQLQKRSSLESQSGALVTELKYLEKERGAFEERLADCGGNLVKVNDSLEAAVLELAKFDASTMVDYTNMKRVIAEMQEELKAQEFTKKKSLLRQGEITANIGLIDQNIADQRKLIEESILYDALNSAFSKNGIPLLILKTQIPLINAELEKILTGITDFNVAFDTEITSSTAFDIFIEDDHSKRVIELASGAEQTFAALAIRVALYNLSNLPKTDIFIMDEVFGALDEQNLPRIEEMLYLLKENFRVVLLITHLPQVKDMVDKIIEVTNDNEESKVYV